MLELNLEGLSDCVIDYIVRTRKIEKQASKELLYYIELASVYILGENQVVFYYPESVKISHEEKQQYIDNLKKERLLEIRRKLLAIQKI